MGRMDPANAATYRHYPFLTRAEFAEVCHYLDRRYTQATLGPLRSQWRLNVHTALGGTATEHAGQVTFLQITKPLDSIEADDQLASRLGNVALNEPQQHSVRRSGRLSKQQSKFDQRMAENEESDTAVLRHSSRTNFRGSGYVVYEIHWHPTYRAPCLWFSLHNLPIDDSPLDIESVFRHLVPDQFKGALRGQGAIGGISIDHHPVTGVPTFFVHPCNNLEFLAPLYVSKEDYLMGWLASAGGCVGLWVPKEMIPCQASG
ncbi:hypothetical protein F4777DRAFT_252037 [Nemania sp. FL0916]|nr:hypothetical protein F4777DRAFT_252037 [Nemania sp. FL0916]